ncbi:MAG: hypothetical protein JSU65_07460 [Candidatus Zixiibacteriota bacterium]|nr:MAG: hypothetical protein JSU65_07460 [candidate division Zixibacteria bacterium]
MTAGCGDDKGDNSQTPAGIKAINGLYYKQDVEDTILSPALKFAVTDGGGDYMAGQQVVFSLLEGDGALSRQNATTGSDGTVALGYTFTDTMGHAVVQASAPGVDSVEVTLRKSMLKTGSNGQGQFILLDDDYGTIKAFNGEPDTLVVDPFYWRFHAVYEASLGVVFIITDADSNEIAGDDELILEIIVNNNEDTDTANDYKGTTPEGVGIGSTIGDAVAAYGTYSERTEDLTPPWWAWQYKWYSLRLVCYTLYHPNTDLENTFVIREIHICNYDLEPSGEAPFVRAKKDSRDY